MARSVWVEHLFISARTAEKLAEKHDLDAQHVRQQIEGVGGLRGSWDYHPERGSRLMLKVTVDQELLLVVLYPRAEDDEWNLGSAYRL